MTTIVANLDTTQYVQVNSARHSAVIQSLGDTVRVVMSSSKPAVANTVFHTLSGKDQPLTFTNFKTDIWVLALTNNATLVMTETSEVGGISNYFIEVAGLNVPNTVDVFQTGANLDISSEFFETLWDQGGNIQYLPSATQLYASSSSANDTDQLVRVCGLDNNRDVLEKTSNTLDGQNQVLIPGGMFRRVRECFFHSGSDVQGEIYIAESTPLAGGIPIDVSKIQTKISLNSDELPGPFASNGVSRNGFFTVPTNADVYILAMPVTVPKDNDVELQVWYKPDGFLWRKLFGHWAYSGGSPVSIPTHTRIREHSDVELRVISGNPNGRAEVNMQFILKYRDV